MLRGIAAVGCGLLLAMAWRWALAIIARQAVFCRSPLAVVAGHRLAALADADLLVMVGGLILCRAGLLELLGRK